MCCTWLAENTRRKNDFKIRHLGTIAHLCRAISMQRRRIPTIGKTLVKQQYVLHMPHNMVNVGLLTSEIGSLTWSIPANFNRFRVLASFLHRRRSMELANQSLYDVWPSHGLVHLIYILGGSYPLAEFYQVQNSLCVQVLRAPILAALLHGTPCSNGVSQTLRRGTRNGITELSHRASSIFGRAAITLGIGPHSSFNMFHTFCGIGSLFLSVNLIPISPNHLFLRLSHNLPVLILHSHHP